MWERAKNLRKRVSSYFSGIEVYLGTAKDWGNGADGAKISTHETRNETEALLLEDKLIKEYKPRYNTDFTDDKQFLFLVRVDLKSALPRFRLCRNRKNDGAHYYGPFAQADLLRSTLSGDEKKFGILLHDKT